MQDMTKGSILSHLIHFAIPMILGNLLQLTYNAVDSIIISKFLGETALAAVSTSRSVSGNCSTMARAISPALWVSTHCCPL